MVLTLLFACIDPYDDDSNPPPSPEGTEVGPEGGFVTVGDLVLEVPPGALVDPVEIHVYDTFDSPPSEYDALSTVWSLEPHGLVFAEPVTITIPFAPPEARASLYWSNDAGGYDVIAAERSDGFMTAQIEHFSTAFVATPPVEVIETADLYPPADFLFVVDNSGSMSEEQSQLASDVVPFVNAVLGGPFSPHIGVITTDMDDSANHAGKLQTAQGFNFVDSATPNPSAVFGQMLNAGTGGSFEEKGRAAAYTMVELRPDIPRNAGFLRDEATLSFVFLSDEEDQSGANPITRIEFREWMETKKARPEDVVAHGIVVLSSGSSCTTGEAPGVNYELYADWTGGAVVDICDTDWTPTLLDVVEPLYDGARVVLPAVPDPSSLVVRLDITVLDPSEYRLEGNTVFFDQGTRPDPGATARIEYVEL